jgi:hypothetical protein
MAEVVNLFLLAAAWGFGASIATLEAKKGLSKLLTTQAATDPVVSELISEGCSLATPGMSLHDHYLNLSTGQWQLWSSKLEEQIDEPSRSQDSGEQPAEASTDVAPSMLVPTAETLRYRYLLD